MKRIGMGLVGPGFVGAHHIDAVRRLGYVDVVALAGSSDASAKEKAQALGVAQSYGRFADLIANENVDVVHNTTPNHLHFEVTLAALVAGKHVISDKPLARTAAEAVALLDAAHKARVANVVTFNYRGNPLVQQARAMIASGEIGEVRFVRGHYLQDWMSDPNVYSWRSDPERGGESSALADIGSHWCDLIEHVTGIHISSVLGDFSTIVPLRYPGTATTFGAGRSAGGPGIPVAHEDAASVLLRFASGAKGSFCVGQVLPGHKNDLEFEVCGSRASLRWTLQDAARLWLGLHDQPNRLIGQSAYLHEAARRHVRLPEGHMQGWSDAFFNVIADAYQWIRAGGGPAERSTALATFEDGVRAARLIEAMVSSNAAGGTWRATA